MHGLHIRDKAVWGKRSTSPCYSVWMIYPVPRETPGSWAFSVQISHLLPVADDHNLVKDASDTTLFSASMVPRRRVRSSVWRRGAWEFYLQRHTIRLDLKPFSSLPERAFHLSQLIRSFSALGSFQAIRYRLSFNCCVHSFFYNVIFHEYCHCCGAVGGWIRLRSTDSGKTMGPPNCIYPAVTASRRVLQSSSALRDNPEAH